MHKLLPYLSVVAAVVWSGCSTHHANLVLDPVGPAPLNAVHQTLTNGTLIVYSAHEINADFNSRDPYRPAYSDYRIYTMAGKLIQKVSNNSGTILSDPAPVTLFPGHYLVKAYANGYGQVSIPISIQAGQVTTVHLEGGNPPNQQFMPSSTNCVRLPNGDVVGWKE